MYRYGVSEHFDVGEKWDFYPPSSCAVLTCIVVGWSVFPLCPIRSQLCYCQKYSGSSMMFSGSLWWIYMIPEFIVGDGKFWLRSGWICFSSSSVIKSSFLYSYNSSCSTSVFHVLFFCINNVSIFMSIFHMVNTVAWVIKSDWFHFWIRVSNCILSRSFVFGCIFILLKSFGSDSCFWLFWRSCSLGFFACMYNGLLKGNFSIVSSCYINSSLTPLLLFPHTIQFSFRYGIDDVLGIWKDLGWYYWLVF